MKPQDFHGKEVSMNYFFVLCIFFMTGSVFVGTSNAKYQPLDDGVVIPLRRGQIRLRLYAEDIVRVTFTPTQSFPERKSLVVLPKNQSPIKWHLEKTMHGLSLKIRRGMRRDWESVLKVNSCIKNYKV